MCRADLVLDDALSKCGSQVWRERQGGIFVNRPEHELTAVSGIKTKDLGLPPASAANRCETACIGAQVENIHLYRGGPQIPVVGPKHEPVKPACLVVLPRDDLCARRKVLLGKVV